MKFLRWLMGWARFQKHGTLRVPFYAYRWVRMNLLPLLYEFAILVTPHDLGARTALASLLEQKYAWMISRHSRDAAQTASVGRRAVECFHTVLSLDPDFLEAYYSCASLLFTLGSVEESLRLLQRALDVQRKLAERHQLDTLRLRFIPPDLGTGGIGLMVHIEAYVKAGLLGVIPSCRPVLLVKPRQRVPNAHFLNYWGQYITVISDPGVVEGLIPLVRYLEDPIHWVVNHRGKLLFLASAAALLNKQWEEENRAPLLTLSKDDHGRGWHQLEQMGVPRGAWFVCVHVREGGFKDNGGIQDTFRNADIGTYLLGLQSIVDRGGWIIRMGNPTMKPLPVMEHVIDYAHSQHRRDWMDVFLCAQCRFFVNTASGPGSIARAFGVPMALTNMLPTSAIMFGSQDLFIPKRCWSVEQRRELTFEELMSHPVSTSVSQHQFDLMKLKVIDNSPEEIDGLLKEMLDRFDGTLNYSLDDERLQERFRELTAAKGTLCGLENVPINCRIGRDFLRKHAALLPDAEPVAISQFSHSA